MSRVSWRGGLRACSHQRPGARTEHGGVSSRQNAGVSSFQPSGGSEAAGGGTPAWSSSANSNMQSIEQAACHAQRPKITRRDQGTARWASPGVPRRPHAQTDLCRQRNVAGVRPISTFGSSNEPKVVRGYPIAAFGASGEPKGRIGWRGVCAPCWKPAGAPQSPWRLGRSSMLQARERASAVRDRVGVTGTGQRDQPPSRQARKELGLVRRGHVMPPPSSADMAFWARRAIHVRIGISL